jgi:hypothetical protein
MGRDQAHGAGDLTNAEILARLMLAQGTKVDPETGTPSTEANAVGPYEFMGDRLLAVHDLFGKFMIGYEIPWVPVAMSVWPDGSIRAMYRTLSQAYRGRLTQNTWEAYYYYKYVRGIDLEQVAPGYATAYAKRRLYNWDGVDGGGDFWLGIPKEAEAEGGKNLVIPVIDPYREVEDRFTPLAGPAAAQDDGTTRFVRSTATPEGTRFSVYAYGSAGTSIGFRIRTDGQATMDVYGNQLALPNTHGQWRYVVVPVALGDYLPLTITGNGTTVDIDHVNIQASTLLSPPAFKSGTGDMTVYTYAGATLATTIDLSATDPAAGDVVTYNIDNLPQGASFNTSTGAFSWTPTSAQAGSYTLVVEASDGTTVTTRRVTIFVGADRQATVGAVTAPVKPDGVYVSSTQAAYQSAYADVQSTIGSGSDDIYFQKLATLKTAVAGLQELNPLLKDGSLDFSNLLFKSNLTTNFCDNAKYLIDGTTDTWVSCPVETGRTYTVDFGPGFKVAANAFQLQSRASFPERIAGVTIFASNDNENWTRITPDETIVSEDLQTLNVQDDQRSQRYRFFKITIFHVVWSYNLLEPGELRIFGTRYETVNKLTSVSVNSDQALKRRVVAGNTIKLTFQSTEPINNVSATIQGEPATVTTADNLNWTATALIKPTTPPGTVKFLMNYNTAAGTAAEPVLFTTDSTSLFIADQKNFIGNIYDIATVTDSNGRNATDVITSTNYLFDNNLTTGTDLRINGKGDHSWLMFDFRGGGTAQLSRVDVIGLQNQYSGRIAGTVVQGSNDNSTWNTISNAAVNSADWQTLTINDPTPYRYIRMFNAGAWFGNMTELRLYGVTASTNKIATASLASPQALRNRIVPGNTVKLNFTAKEAISNVTATIDGLPAALSTTDNITYTATATLPQGTQPGQVKFAINYLTQDGKTGYQVTETTDATSLNLVDESDTIKNVPTIATLIDSTTNRTAATTLSNVNALFDANLTTGSDFRNGSAGSGTGAWIVFDFKTGNQVTLTSTEVIGRQDQYYTRVNGLVFQGSNDNTNWTTLTPAAKSTADWQTLPVSGLAPYRYIRVYNPNAWFGSMNEVRLHGSLHGVDTIAPVTTDNAPTGTVNQDTAVILTPTDSGGSGVQATYYTVDGGAQQTGTTVALTTDGTHTIIYWSVDWAGNVEQKHTVTVTVDKTPPTTAGLYADVTAPTNQNVSVSIYYPEDATVREYKLGDAGAWTAYTAPVVVTENTTVYARGKDTAGNVSAISSLVVGNINKVPPAGASFVPSSMDPTTGNVTVAITYPANVAARQYRVGDAGGWMPYTGPVVVTDNAVVYAQSTDAAGNVSPVTTYAVTNIDRIAPLDAQFTANITDPTNKDVLVTVVFPDDAAVKEYRIGENGTWMAYGGPVLMSDNGTVFARGADAAGNVSNVTQYNVSNIDRIPPVGATLVVDTTAPTNQAVNVTITYPADAAVRELKVGGGDWTPYTGTVQVASDTTVFARGTDAVGNVSNVTSIVVSNIYKVVPTTSVAMLPASPNGKNSWYTTDVALTLAVNPGSYGGAVTTEYQVNGGAWTATSGETLTFSEGVYTVAYRSRDEAGNVEQTKTIQFQVDKTAPTLSVALDKSTIWPPNHTMVPVIATLSATDAGAGIESAVLTSITSDKPDSGLGDIHADFGTPSTTFSVRAEKDRVYTVTFTATDKAGNKTVKTATVTVPHDESGASLH